MTTREKAESIIKNGNCLGIACYSGSDCPCVNMECYEYQKVPCVQQWLLDNFEQDVGAHSGITDKDFFKEHDDDMKPAMELIPVAALEGLAAVLTYGAKKYSRGGWKTLPNGIERFMGSLLRHYCKYMTGEKLDPESGLPHLDHMLANAAFVATLDKERP